MDTRERKLRREMNKRLYSLRKSGFFEDGEPAYRILNLSGNYFIGGPESAWTLDEAEKWAAQYLVEA